MSWQLLKLQLFQNPRQMKTMCFLINPPGIFYGQCSEIIGENNNVIPIVIEKSRRINVLIEFQELMNNHEMTI